MAFNLFSTIPPGGCEEECELSAKEAFDGREKFSSPTSLIPNQIAREVETNSSVPRYEIENKTFLTEQRRLRFPFHLALISRKPFFPSIHLINKRSVSRVDHRIIGRRFGMSEIVVILREFRLRLCEELNPICASSHQYSRAWRGENEAHYILPMSSIQHQEQIQSHRLRDCEIRKKRTSPIPFSSFTFPFSGT